MGKRCEVGEGDKGKMAKEFALMTCTRILLTHLSTLVQAVLFNSPASAKCCVTEILRRIGDVRSSALPKRLSWSILIVTEFSFFSCKHQVSK